MVKTSRPVKERRPLKVKVSEMVEEKDSSNVDEGTEKAVDTVEENEIPEVKTKKPNMFKQMLEEAEKESTIKERTEEELAILPREKFIEVEADIRAGKAKVKPRQINK
jgi:hypothetical protein